ncbi:Tautomerase/MIF superfamily [Dunaliella salina]|uniref:Tautomerase/MIF superfamily n=1 Tax=Dunaliella salina TaxID=3046 RepID=A0ABQ7FVZ9_DUNSA|nr:Tautomerase/MIF superfamily [Dunaliella salina]|eukprot:KAF5826560.1 Tautomerase/MIF superfamily [Dunaliella salina]
MPLITITTNVECSPEGKAKLAQLINQEVTNTHSGTPASHVHVHIMASEFLSFGGDANSPCATVTVKCAAQLLDGAARKSLVERIVPLLQSNLGCSPERTTTFFHEVPVEAIAVGTNIMVFSK